MGENFGMSKAVNHMEKYKMSDLGGIQHEDFKRDKDNPNLDSSRTKNNVVLEVYPDENRRACFRVKKKASLIKEVNKRIKELPKKPRKDAVVCCSFIVSADKEFFDKLSETEMQNYFKKAIRFYGKKFGYANILYASVHLDEATPHMHLRIFPRTADGRLCAKELFNRVALQQLHKDFQEYMKSDYIHSFELEECEHGNKGKKHQSELAYRCKMLEEKVKELENKLADVQVRTRMAEQNLEVLGQLKSTHIDDLSQTIDAMQKLPPELREQGVKVIMQAAEKARTLEQFKKHADDGMREIMRTRTREIER